MKIRGGISPTVVLSLSLSLCLWVQSHGFLAKHPSFAFAKQKCPDLTVRSLYTSDFDILNQTDSIWNGPTFGVSQPKTRKLSPAVTSQDTTIQSKYNVTLLLIDHYDSFTYNLYDMLAQLCVNPPIVLAKDAFQDWSEVEQVYGANTIDGIILSPGPGTPTHPEDIGTLSASIIQQNPDLPILGVCLGHQIMGHVYGANVDLCGPVHGQVRPIEQRQSATEEVDALWKNIPPRFNVTRYHSLAVTLPEGHSGSPLLKPTAYSKDHGPEQRILMGMSHTDNPHYGVQFHPESIGSEYGHQLLRNFCDICMDQGSLRKGKLKGESKPHIIHESTPRPHGHDRIIAADNAADSEDVNLPQKPKHQVFVHKVAATNLLPLDVFEEFLSEEQYSVWLDTSIGVQSATTDAALPSYSSILGGGRNTVEYFGKEHGKSDQGLFCYDSNTGSTVRSPHDNILTFLQEEHASLTDAVTMVSFDDDVLSTAELAEDETDLPFDFRGGHVGYLGYEVRHDSERFLEEEEHGSRAKWKPVEDSLLSPPPPSERTDTGERTPTAAFVFLDKSFVYDHSADDWYLISVMDLDEASDQTPTASREASLDWMRLIAQRMKDLSHKEFLNTSGNFNGKSDGSATDAMNNGNSSPGRKGQSLRFAPNRSRDCYNQNFADCQEQIRLGESYELCLTNQLEADVTLPAEKSPLDLYKLLRKRNPAPFSAFLNWNASGGRQEDKSEVSSSSLAVCCSSPERFVSVKRMQAGGPNRSADGTSTKLQVEAKPIKGTCARVIPQDEAAGLSFAEARKDQRRATELKESVKNRAENLMIVDLLRNDLSRVCEVGSVHVSKLMDIESYATVHQMVSTIRGTLDCAKANSVDVLKATFPGGSMTGAPKIRTMEILDRLEEGVSRGPYSGCLGYISLNGSMDMNIVIRSAVLIPKTRLRPEGDGHEWKVKIGAGGAITALSESTDEYEEMILKASAVMNAVEEWSVAKDHPGCQSPKSISKPVETSTAPGTN